MCLKLIEKMHSKVFLNRRIFISSLVGKSSEKVSVSHQTPEKSKTSLTTPCVTQDTQTEPQATHLTPSLNSNLLCHSSNSKEEHLTGQKISPSIQEKLEMFDFEDTKRKAGTSPELSKKEKKKLKNQEKASRKNEQQGKNKIIC